MLKFANKGTYVWAKVPLLNGVEHTCVGTLEPGEHVIVYDDDSSDAQYCIALTRFGLGSVFKESLT